MARNETRREERRKNGSEQKAKPSTPTQAIDAQMGEEKKRKQREEQKQERAPTPVTWTIYIKGGGESGLNCWRVKGSALVLFLLYVNVSGMLPRSCMSSSLRRYRLPGFSSVSGGLSSRFPPWVTASCYIAGNREAKLKPNTFSSLLFFLVFLSFLFF